MPATMSAAGSAQEARELVRTRRFELILLDIWMPGTDGITLLREWANREEVHCPIVMMSVTPRSKRPCRPCATAPPTSSKSRSL